MEIEKKIELLADLFDVEKEEIVSDQDLASFDAWDSMSKLSLIVMMDEDCEKKLTGEDILCFRTIGDIIDFMGQIFMLDGQLWDEIAPLMPDDVSFRRVLFDDYVWFVNRQKKYKNDQQRIKDYIHHLELKSNTDVRNLLRHSEVFKSINTTKIKLYLMEKYKIESCEIQNY